MRKLSLKIFSLVLTISLLSSLFVLPANAVVAGANADLSMKLVKVVGETDSFGNKSEDHNIYKLIVSLDTNVSLQKVQTAVVFDNTVLTPCYRDADSGEIYFDDIATAEFPTFPYNRLGILADAGSYNAEGAAATGKKVMYYGPAHPSSMSSYVIKFNISGDGQYEEGLNRAGITPDTNKYGMIFTQWSASTDATKPTVMPYGKTDLYEFYFTANGDVDGTELRFTLGDFVTSTAPTYVNSTHPGGAFHGSQRVDGIETYTPDGTVYTYTASATTTSILNPLKSQIRFDKNADGTYAGTFDVRQLAVVSKADFENTFGTTVDAQKAAIAEVGFVFARTSTVATFDVDAAKALIENGTAAAGYTKKTVDYITTNAGVVGADNYGISCIIEDLPTADNTDGMYALAYIKGTDSTYYYYPAAANTSFNDLYSRNYSQAFPG